MDKKVANRYSLILDIISYEGNVISYNYAEFLKKFNIDLNNEISKSAPLVAVDSFTIKFANSDEFDRRHREILGNDFYYTQFMLLTNLDPNNCRFDAHIEYKAHNNFGGNMDDRKFLDVVYGDNKYLKRFVENNISNKRAEYNFNQIIWFVWDFYNRVISNEEFYLFALERLGGFHNYNRFSNRESWLINEIKECRVDALENGNKFSVTRLNKLKRYKSFRAAAMVMSEYDKNKTSEYYYEHRHK